MSRRAPMPIRPAVGDTDPIRCRRPHPDGQFSGNSLDEAMRSYCPRVLAAGLKKRMRENRKFASAFGCHPPRACEGMSMLGGVSMDIDMTALPAEAAIRTSRYGSSSVSQ
jgi:hypothetical protein